MVLDFPASRITKERDLAHVESLLCRCAAELALLGNIDVSRELLGMLYRQGSLTGNYARQYFGLAFAWRETGQSPEGLSDDDLEGIISAARDVNESLWGDVEKTERSYDEAGLQACLTMIASHENQFADARTGSRSMDKGRL